MTNQTPIEKAAEELEQIIQLAAHGSQEYPTAAEIAERFRRRLEKEVPKREPSGARSASAAIERMEAANFNQCRRAIGLRDEEETEA